MNLFKVPILRAFKNIALKFLTLIFYTPSHLLPEQAQNLFKKECALLKVKFDENASKKVSNLGLLAPGDFASVRRQAKFRPIKNGEDFCHRLELEVALKNEEKSAKIGF